MLFESADSRAAQDVFQELSDKLRQSQYKIGDAEKRALAECSSEIGARVLTWCGGGAAAGYMLVRQTAGVGKSTRWGRFIASTAGCYLGTQIAMRGVKERCLGRIVALPTPLGGEAAALLRSKNPNSRMLAAAPPDAAFEGGPPSRLLSAAATQQAQQVHQQAAADLPQSPMFGVAADQPPPMIEHRPTGQQQPAVEQPDAFGPASDLFGGSGSGARGGWAGDSSGADDAPQGLDTVHRPQRRRRGFAGAPELGGATLGGNAGSEWVDEFPKADRGTRSF